MDGIEARKVTNEETGEVTVEKYQGPKVDASIYKFRFDEFTSRAWEKDKFQNEWTLTREEHWDNDKLRVDGYLFLNDVLDRLGIDRIPAGQIVGWRYNKGNGDNYVDFRVVDEAIYVDPENPKQIFYNGDFVCNSGENAYTLDFNCDGDILTDF